MLPGGAAERTRGAGDLRRTRDVPSARPLRRLGGDQDLVGAMAEVVSDLRGMPEYGEMVQRRHDERLPVGFEERFEEVEGRTGWSGLLDVHLGELEPLLGRERLQLSTDREELAGIAYEGHRDEPEG